LAQGRGQGPGPALSRRYHRSFGRSRARLCPGLRRACFDVALLARGDAGLEGAARDVKEVGGRAPQVPADVSNFDEVDAAAGLVEKELGPVDVWANNAMTTVFAPTWDVKPADFRRAVEVRCETSLDRHPQPVPPIYRPEVAAKSIVEMALGERSTKVVGSWNKILVAAGRMFPSLGNHYASLGACDTQLAAVPTSPDRPVSTVRLTTVTITAPTVASTIRPMVFATPASSRPCRASPAPWPSACPARPSKKDWATWPPWAPRSIAEPG
jgi:short chain dehydrogenase